MNDTRVVKSQDGIPDDYQIPLKVPPAPAKGTTPVAINGDVRKGKTSKLRLNEA